MTTNSTTNSAPRPGSSGASAAGVTTGSPAGSLPTSRQNSTAAEQSSENVNAALSPGRRWSILLLILIPVFIGALDLTIVSAILPEILTRLNIPVDTNLDIAAWAITGYLLAYIVSMAVTGRLSDLIGRRAVYLGCLAIFIVGSYWVATAHEWPTEIMNQVARQWFGVRPDNNQLTLIAVIIGRVIQALGAGAMVPVSFALVADLFPDNKRAQPIGLIGAIDTLGWVLGHLYGGVMVNYFTQNGAQIEATLRNLGLNWPAPDWHTLFFLNVPIGIVAFILTIVALRGVKHPRGEGGFDLIGTFLLAGSLIALTVGLGGRAEVSGATSLQRLGEESSGTPFNPILIIGAIVTFVAFIAWEWRRRYPMIELHLFKKRNVSSAAAANLLIGFCLMLGLVSVPLLVNLRAEDTSARSIALAAERAGILLSALTIPMAIVAIPGGSLASRVGYRTTTAAGLLIAAVGFLIAGLTWRADTPDLVMAGHMILVGIGLGITIAPIGTAVINEAKASQHGVASALVIILRLLGMTLAVSFLTAFALTRVNGLFQEMMVGRIGDQAVAVRTYFEAGVQVIREMLLIGAAACTTALIPALGLHGKSTDLHVSNPDLPRTSAATIGRVQ